MARKAGLCDKWFSDWKDDETTQSLLDKYKLGIDFSIDTDWISNDFIKSHWSKKVLQENLIYVDDTIETDCSGGTVIINGKSDILMRCGMYSVTDIYARHDSRLKVIATDNASVMVNVYDNAEIIVDSSDKSKVYVYVHSDSCTVKDVGTNGFMKRFSKI